MKIKTFLRQYYRDVNTFLMKHIRGYRGMHPKAFVMKPYWVAKDLRMGAYSHLSSSCSIGTKVEIGNYVMCGPEVMIALGEHSFDRPGVATIFSGTPRRSKTVIEDDAWIGARALIKTGVRVGRGSVVAMGAVVVADVEPYSIVGGVPARKIRMRFSDEGCAIHEEMLRRDPIKGEYCE